jgi:hypothetical protein
MEAVRTLARSSPGGPPVTPTTLVVLLALAAGPAAAVAGSTSGTVDAPPGSVDPGDGPSVVDGGPAATSNVTVYRARNATFEGAGAVEAAIASGRLERAAELVVGDTLVVAIDSTRLAETMAADEGSTTERFLDALDGDAGFRLVQTNPTPNAERKVASVGPENVTAHRNGTTTYALVETDDLAFRYRSTNRSARIHGGERFVVRFGHDLAELPRGEDPAAPVVGFHPFRAEFDTNGYWYEPLPPERVRLRVNVEIEPDESLVARVSLDDDRTVSAPVGPDHAPGPDEVWLDLRSVEPGTEYDLELVHDGDVVDRYRGIVREPRAALSNATLTWYGGGTAVGVTASASHGGKVQVLDESCDVLGSTWIAPGGDRRVTVELWTGGGHRIQFRPDVLVRVARHRGASDPFYRGPAARATLGFEDTLCPVRDSPSTPTPTPATPTPTTSPTPDPGDASRTPTGSPHPPTTPGTEPSDGAAPSTGSAGGGNGEGDESVRTGRDGASGFSAPVGRDGASGFSAPVGRDGESGFTVPVTLLGLVTLALLGARHR